MPGYAEVALVRGMAYLADAQAAIAHNLANIDSAGFKRRASYATTAPSSFDSMLGVQLPTVVYAERGDMSAGQVKPTGENMHIAIEGDDKLYFRIKGDDGSTFYTRKGQMLIDSLGRLTTPDGRRFLDPSGAEISLATGDGAMPSTLIVRSSGTLVDGKDSERVFGTLGTFRVTDPSTLEPVGKGAFRDPSRQAPISAPTNSIRQGFLEQSNVDSIQEMVQMLVVERAFQATSKAMTTVARLQEQFSQSMGRA